MVDGNLVAFISCIHMRVLCALSILLLSWACCVCCTGIREELFCALDSEHIHMFPALIKAAAQHVESCVQASHYQRDGLQDNLWKGLRFMTSSFQSQQDCRSGIAFDTARYGGAT